MYTFFSSKISDCSGYVTLLCIHLIDLGVLGDFITQPFLRLGLYIGLLVVALPQLFESSVDRAPTVCCQFESHPRQLSFFIENR